MRSRMIGLCLSASLGLISVNFFAELSTSLLLGLIPIFLAFLLLSYRWPCAQLIFCFLLGLFWGGYQGLQRVEARLPQELEGQTLQLVGTVVAVDQHWSKGEENGLKVQRFLIKPEQIYIQPDQSHELSTVAEAWLKNAQREGRVRLSWYPPRKSFNHQQVRGSVAKNIHADIEHLQPGQRWQLSVRMKRPHGFASHGAFNYEAWMFRQGILANGYVVSHPGNQWLGEAGGMFSWPSKYQAWRNDFLNSLYQCLQSYSSAGSIMTLVAGERRALTQSQWDLLSRTGTSHLLVISGLHIGFVAGLAYGLFMCLGRLLMLVGHRFWPSGVACQPIALLASLIVALGYSLLAGFGLPTQRALIMLAVLAGGQLVGRPTGWWQRFVLALLLVLMWDPFAPLSAGFWLSFGAVAVLILGLGGYVGRGVTWQAWVKPQWLVGLGLIPCLAAHFQGFSLYAPLINLVAIPMIGLIAVPMALIGSLMVWFGFEFAHWVLVPLDYLLEFFWQLLAWVAYLPGQYVQLSGVGYWGVGLAAVGVLVLLLPKGLPSRWLGLLLLLPLLLGVRKDWSDGRFDVAVLDVGQGLAVVVRTQQHSLLYDTGPRYSSNFNSADAVVLPYLRFQGITHLNRLIISHADNDHAGSLQPLLEEISYGDLAWGSPKTGRQDLSRSRPCDQLPSWEWDGVQFELLQLPIAQRTNKNNESCVLLISNGQHSVLLPGDIDSTGEKKLIEQLGLQPLSLLLAPHHGSKSSSSSAFIQAVDPAWVVFAAGYRNPYHHPHPSVVRRYEQQGSLWRNTASSGTLTFTFKPTNEKPEVQAYREKHRRYWFNSEPVEPLKK